MPKGAPCVGQNAADGVSCEARWGLLGGLRGNTHLLGAMAGTVCTEDDSLAAVIEGDLPAVVVVLLLSCRRCRGAGAKASIKASVGGCRSCAVEGMGSVRGIDGVRGPSVKLEATLLERLYDGG